MESTFNLVVGLGNPGPEYEGTRHNAGFEVVDRLAGMLRRAAPEKRTARGVLLRGECGGRPLGLFKPLTFMNASGLAVRQLAAELGLMPEEILVVYDCLDLPLGRLRLRRGGSDGGHRGVASIIRELETDKFPRLRVGIGRPESGTTIDYVLSPWTSAERPLVEQTLSAAAQAIRMARREGLESAMNRYNGWTADENDANEHQEKAVENV